MARKPRSLLLEHNRPATDNASSLTASPFRKFFSRFAIKLVIEKVRSSMVAPGVVNPDMADIFTPEKRSAVMARILSRGNKDTEIKLMEMLRAEGIRGWRRHAQIVIGRGRGTAVKRPVVKPGGTRMMKKASPPRVRPDFVFWKARVAVFVDGCFWHGCPRHGTQPQQNGEFWSAKIMRNQKRDRKVARELRKDGWVVLRVWECALSKARAARTLGRIRRAVVAP